MHSCHHHMPFIGDIMQMDISIFLIVFLVGVVGGFTHCIGMCGPFAINISGVRLINAKSTGSGKLRALFAMPYYIGKSFSYTTIAIIFFYTSSILQNIWGYNYIAFGLLSLIAILFLMQAFGMGIEVFRSNSKYSKVIEKAFNKVFMPKNNQFGLNGLITGYILGFIPCGLVVLMITFINSSFDNIFNVVAATFLFGISTVPALFCISLVGVIRKNEKFSKILKIMHAVLMIICAYLTFVYALKVV